MGNPYKEDREFALVIVDVQPDFYTKGPLATKGGEEIAQLLGDVMPEYGTVVLTQDSHPAGHISFASSYKGKKAFDLLRLADVKAGGVQSPLFSNEQLTRYLEKLPNQEQTLWPDHCVQGTTGWFLDPRLRLDKADMILRKGTRPDVDSLSAFYENDGTSTGLGVFLRERGIRKVGVVGLAGDICVYLSARDAIRDGFKVVFDPDLCRYVDQPEGAKERALEDLKTRGVIFENLL